jgi:hypothetical protein
MVQQRVENRDGVTNLRVKDGQRCIFLTWYSILGPCSAFLQIAQVSV